MNIFVHSIAPCAVNIEDPRTIFHACVCDPVYHRAALSVEYYFKVLLLYTAAVWLDSKVALWSYFF